MNNSAEVLGQGWRLHESGNYAAAEQIYRQVLEEAPNDPNAWCYLGMALHDQDRLDEAVLAFRRALEIQPHFPVAFNNMGNSFRVQGRFEAAVSCFDQALRLKPDYVKAIKNKSTTLFWNGRLDEATEVLRKALNLEPEDSEAHKNLGLILLLRGDFEKGWREYAWRWKLSGVSLPKFSQPIWDGSSLDGKTILLTTEQGLGDTVHFIRYATWLKQEHDCRIIVVAQKPLLPLLESCRDIDHLTTRDGQSPQFDVYVPVMSLPAVLGHDLESFPSQVPYLFSDDGLIQTWKRELSAYHGYKVGIAWQGNPKHEADAMRSVPLREFAPVGQLKGVTFFSLQKGAGVEQLDTLAGRLDVVYLGDHLDEEAGAFMDTAAVLKSLDLLITSDSAIGHVAGAIGVPVWLALPHVPDWRWLLDRDDSPWYPTMRLFRQPVPGDWCSVFTKMAEELDQMSPGIGRKAPDDYRIATSGFNRLTRCRHGLMLYNRNDAYIGRALDLYGEFSEGEIDLFRQVVRKGNVIVEAGSNVGPHTPALSRLVGPNGAVYAFEPQRIPFQALCANMALNSCTNVFCHPEALGERAGSIFVPHVDYDSANNFGGLGLGGYETGERTPLVTLDSLELDRCHLIKVDVEGMEIEVLRGAQKTIETHHPVLYVENDRTEKSAVLIEHIMSLGYRLYWHLPPLFNPGNYFGNSENVFGKTVSVNMLCIHSSANASITGLRPIEGPHSDWRDPES
ncbi:FkbM family methyltransferase [Thermodesulfobacteriota bacterium]